jgi:hypothetical protein
MSARKTVTVALAVVAVLGIGSSTVLGLQNAELRRTVIEARAEIQKLRLAEDAWKSAHPVPQDSASAFVSNYGAGLLKIRYLTGVYSKDRSEENRQQLQRAVDEFVQFVHAWQQLIAASAPMLNASVATLLTSSQAGDVSRLEQALDELDRGAGQSGVDLNRAITSVNKAGERRS